MRQVRIFRSKPEYEAFVLEELIGDRTFLEHTFYRNLIQFVLDAKAPIFYSQSHPSEYANFSPYYNSVLIRDNYVNRTLRAMYFLHDFMHMLFYYPHDMASVTQSEFDDAVILGEYAASNETEILLHYRAPDVRPRVFQDRRLFFDILRERGVAAQPSVLSLFHLRRQIIETDHLDPFFFLKPQDEPVRKTFKSYRANGAWCKHRFVESLKLKNPTEYYYQFLTPMNYERVLSSYGSASTQDTYERTVLMNVRLHFAFLGLEDPPVRFEECLERGGALEGRVLFQEEETP